MKLTTAFVFVLALSLALMAGGCSRRAYAADRQVTGSIGIETPIGQTPDRPQNDSPMVVGDLHLNHVLGPLGLYGGANVNLKRGMPFCSENKFWTGIELPVGNQGLVTYGYFERRFDMNDNRFVVGAKLNFHSRY